jgi:hypothetical protein
MSDEARSNGADRAASLADSHSETFDRVAGLSGALVGAGIGSAAGPVGAVIGGVAGALGGWWAGIAILDAARSVSQEDDGHFRSHYDLIADRPADRAYDDVRSAYYLGQIASHNPEFVSSEFAELDGELERAWTPFGSTYGSWPSVRDYAAAGFARGRSKLDDAARRGRTEWESRPENDPSGGL